MTCPPPALSKATHDVRPMNGGRGQPSTLTGTSVRGNGTLYTRSAWFHVPAAPRMRTISSVGKGPGRAAGAGPAGGEGGGVRGAAASAVPAIKTRHARR